MQENEGIKVGDFAESPEGQLFIITEVAWFGEGKVNCSIRKATRKEQVKFKILKQLKRIRVSWREKTE